MSDLHRKIEKLIKIYGKEAFAEIAAHHTKPRRGRPKDDDKEIILSNVTPDMVDWLAGENPKKIRTDYAVAKAAIARLPVQQHDSSRRRIIRKLKNDRQILYLMAACTYAMTHYDFYKAMRRMKRAADEHAVMEALVGPLLQKLDEFPLVFEERFDVSPSELKINVALSALKNGGSKLGGLSPALKLEQVLQSLEKEPISEISWLDYH